MPEPENIDELRKAIASAVDTLPATSGLRLTAQMALLTDRPEDLLAAWRLLHTGSPRKSTHAIPTT